MSCVMRTESERLYDEWTTASAAKAGADKVVRAIRAELTRIKRTQLGSGVHRLGLTPQELESLLLAADRARGELASEEARAQTCCRDNPTLEGLPPVAV